MGFSRDKNRRSTAGHSGEERHFIACRQGLIQAAEFLIARTHQVLLGQHIPHPAAGQQGLAPPIKAGGLPPQPPPHPPPPSGFPPPTPPPPPPGPSGCGRG